MPVIVLSCLLAVQFQLAPWRRARTMHELSPCMEQTPAMPADRSVAGVLGKRIHYGGYSLQLPWQHVDLWRLSRGSIIITSESGQLITLSNPRDPFDIYEALRKSVVASHAHGKSDIAYNFSLLTLAMMTKPGDVKWGKTQRQNAPLITRLWIKSLAMTECRGPLYTVGSQMPRGFQQGDPSSGHVRLDLFDRADRHYGILIDSANMQSVITQSEINGMIASLVPIS